MCLATEEVNTERGLNNLSAATPVLMGRLEGECKVFLFSDLHLSLTAIFIHTSESVYETLHLISVLANKKGICISYNFLQVKIFQ